MRDKKLLILICGICLVLVALPFLAACPAEETTPPPETTTPPPETTTPPPEPVTLVFSCMEPEQSMYVEEIFKPLFAEIERHTEGMVTVEPHYSSSLVPMEELYDAVIKGTVDMGMGIQAFVPGKFPLDEITFLFPYDSLCWRTSRIQWDLYEAFPEYRAQYADVKLIWMTNEPTYICTAKKQITKMEDLEGMKILVAGEWGAERIAALGAVPTAVPPPGYTELERGIVDGGNHLVLHLLWDFRLGDVLHYIISNVHSGGSNMYVVMNKETWNNLSPDVQNIIEELTGPNLADKTDVAQILADRENRVLAQQEFGIEYNELSPEEIARWVEANKAVGEAFIDKLEALGLPGRQFYEEYMRLTEKYSAEEYTAIPE
jgi:TRAP-type C4-dicarboxylate transport system substrate-binding protein